MRQPSFAEIGRAMGISHQRAQQLYKNAMRKLSRNTAGRELIAALEQERSERSRAMRLQEVPSESFQVH